MATDKPRITVTLDPADYAIIKRLAALQGGTMSRIVKELVSTVTPALGRVADVLERAQGAEGEVLDGLRSSVEGAQDGIESLLAQTEGAFWTLLDDVDAATGNPPSSNTGGTPTPLPLTSPSPKGSDDAV